MDYLEDGDPDACDHPVTVTVAGVRKCLDCGPMEHES